MSLVKRMWSSWIYWVERFAKSAGVWKRAGFAGRADPVVGVVEGEVGKDYIVSWDLSIFVVYLSSGTKNYYS